MERPIPPGQGSEPEVVNDAPDDARGYNLKAWSIIRVVFGLIALLFLLSLGLWLGELVGLFAIALPGG